MARAARDLARAHGTGDEPEMIAWLLDLAGYGPTDGEPAAQEVA